MTVVLIIFAFIAGIIVGRDYESSKWLEDSLNNFAETERLRNENAYLKQILRIREEETKNDQV